MWITASKFCTSPSYHLTDFQYLHGACWTYQVYFYWSVVKINGSYYWNLLLRQHLLPAIRSISGPFLFLHVSTMQCPGSPVTMLAKRLQRYSSDRSTGHQTASSWLRDVGHFARSMASTIWKNDWYRFHQRIIDRAVGQSLQCLRSCSREKGGHFEHQWVLV